MANLALRELVLENFRAHKSTGPMRFSRLNIFVGANNSGKTSVLASIEVFLRALCDGGPALAIESVPQFSSFDAAIRKSWSKGVRRATEFSLSYKVAASSGQLISCKYLLGEAEYGGGVSIKQVEIEASIGSLNFDVSSKEFKWRFEGQNGKLTVKNVPFFYHLVPMIFDPSVPNLVKLTTSLSDDLRGHAEALEVVNPHRPAPRSLYVLDDPGLRSEDKELVSFLVESWTNTAERSKSVRERIRSGMRTLGLAQSFEVKEATNRKSGGVFEIIVAPTRARQKVSLADAGFGLSQVLPLLVADARMDGGFLIAYQPELHLHPFAQSRLADVFAKSISRGNQLFVETHSVDLVLRIQRLIAGKQLESDSVALFFVENSGSHAVAERVGFDANGAPNRPFPKGFMDVSFDTVKELSRARIQQSAGKAG